VGLGAESSEWHGVAFSADVKVRRDFLQIIV